MSIKRQPFQITARVPAHGLLALCWLLVACGTHSASLGLSPQPEDPGAKFPDGTDHASPSTDIPRPGADAGAAVPPGSSSPAQATATIKASASAVSSSSGSAVATPTTPSAAGSQTQTPASSASATETPVEVPWADAGAPPEFGDGGLSDAATSSTAPEVSASTSESTTASQSATTGGAP